MAAESNAARSTATVAHKVLNNNVVISIDEAGRERVLMGGGLGFQLKPHDTIDPAKVEKTYVLDQGADGDRARELLTDAPYAVVEAVTTAVDEAERMLGRDLGRRLPLAVIDHIQFVLERLQQGVRIPTTSMPELRVLHPQEFAAATRMAASISTSLGTALPDEEAVFLTMHLLNATRDGLASSSRVPPTRRRLAPSGGRRRNRSPSGRRARRRRRWSAAPRWHPHPAAA